MDEIREIDITPPTTLISAQASQCGLGWQTVLCELIDNSLDAEATVVDVTVGPQKGALSIRDNGRGCVSLASVFKFGEHVSNGAKTIGRYGIGLKDSALWAAGDRGKLQVTTVRDDKIRTMTADFAYITTVKKWTIRPEDQSIEPRNNESTGTEITIYPLIRKHPTDGFAAIIESLGYYYSPAIKNKGVNITLKIKGNSYLVKPYKWPVLEEASKIDAIVNVGGKCARVVFGIVQDPTKNTRPGITYSHASRVIVPASSKGCGAYSISSVCGFVELGDGWKLDKNKQGIDKDAEELFDAVFEKVKGILEIAQARFDKTESARVIREAQDAMNHILGFTDGPNAKAVRGQGDSHGTRYPTGNGSKHKQASKEQPGRTFHSGRRPVQFDVVQFDEVRRFMIGYCEPGGKVLLNANHDAVIKAQKTVEGLLMIVVPIYAEALANEEPSGQKRLRGLDRLSERNSFSEIYGELLNMIYSHGAVA